MGVCIRFLLEGYTKNTPAVVSETTSVFDRPLNSPFFGPRGDLRKVPFRHEGSATSQVRERIGFFGGKDSCLAILQVCDLFGMVSSRDPK